MLFSDKIGAISEIKSFVKGTALNPAVLPKIFPVAFGSSTKMKIVYFGSSIGKKLINEDTTFL